MKVLVLNCGSSSVKFQLIETDPELVEKAEEKVLAKGLVERIGEPMGKLKYSPTGKDSVVSEAPVPRHQEAIERILSLLTDAQHGVVQSVDEIEVVGHRMVHGGEEFKASVIINDQVLAQIEKCSRLAPLHNPHNIRGYLASRETISSVPHVAVFDTAFHQSMPEYAYLYALPYEMYKEQGIRRYGFHGTSHRYVSNQAARMLGKKRWDFKIITCHLGNGCSMAAIDNGKSVDTSMGLTPLEGLVMGTRCGDIDPAVVLYMIDLEGYDPERVGSLMNKKSGLLGVSGVSNDMRELLQACEQGNARAQIAVDLFCYRIKKYIGAYAAAMGGVDLVIFTGGIGENAPIIRKKCCENLSFMNIEIDDQANANVKGRDAIISNAESYVKVFVVHTNEEVVIARDSVQCVLAVTPE